MIYNLGEANSLVSHLVAQLRDVEIQKNRMLFRKNLFRLGQIAGYELSKTLEYETRAVETPLGVCPSSVIKEPVVLGTILRAGLPLHDGLLDFLDASDNAFISAYRKHAPDGSFKIELEYVSCPSLDGRVLILADPMLATGQSLALTLQELREFGVPKTTHIVCAIAARPGIKFVQSMVPNAHIWTAAIDEELNDKAYIVPGLGDAGDLSYGLKLQY